MHTHLEQERICGDVFWVKMNQSIRNPETLSTPNINIKRENNNNKKRFKWIQHRKKKKIPQSKIEHKIIEKIIDLMGCGPKKAQP